jgi:hypothetical protein
VRESSDIFTRIDRLASRASEARPAGRLLGEMEDLLPEGYLEALAGEARSRRLAERLDVLVESLDQPGAAVEIRTIVPAQRRLDAEVAVLRDRLGLLREQFLRLRAQSPPAER